jgi:hypothetical protein
MISPPLAISTASPLPLPGPPSWSIPRPVFNETQLHLRIPQVITLSPPPCNPHLIKPSPLCIPQVVEPLPGGRSLKLTVAKYFTPSGRCIQAVSYAKPQKESALTRAIPKAAPPSGIPVPTPTVDPAIPPTAVPGPPITQQKGREAIGLRTAQDARLSPALADTGGGALPALPNSGGGAGPAPDDTGGGADAEARRRADAYLRSRETFTERSMRAGEVFTTANGREVKTGGGIAPDVQVRGLKI